ncbi:uncharacterized protein EHS24_004223 [Apiotrichum porosum]|uniref:Uncharacterized protein n=1 Tax=Apiotrichum porosum TaxID=105984 RepID=A0A427Y4L2_9TREE|nr:uncharacterized protein EHS24_004223 [Apiotrichum porosum]RSH86024.1 hypothetical protein EHS24_004223 [Apiotrichum porosum]
MVPPPPLPAPPLNSYEREAVKSFGGWTAFCNAYGLKPQNADDNEEAYQIVKRMGENDRLDAEEKAKAGKAGAGRR